MKTVAAHGACNYEKKKSLRCERSARALLVGRRFRNSLPSPPRERARRQPTTALTVGGVGGVVAPTHKLHYRRCRRSRCDARGYLHFDSERVIDDARARDVRPQLSSSRSSSNYVAARLSSARSVVRPTLNAASVCVLIECTRARTSSHHRRRRRSPFLPVIGALFHLHINKTAAAWRGGGGIQLGWRQSQNAHRK